MTSPSWAKDLLEVSKGNLQKRFSLDDLAYNKLKECKTNNQGTITYDKIWLKLCRQFNINKKECLNLLRTFEAQGKIKFVKQKGISVIAN